MAFLQATAVAIGGRAVVLIGPPGCGKSDLALRLIGSGATLIGDDAIDLLVSGHRLLASPWPGRVRRLDVAHIGPVPVPLADATVAALVVTLDPAAPATDRSPRVGSFGPIDGMMLPRIALPAFHGSTPDTLLLALERWGH